MKSSEGAFSKNNLNYDENEIENLEKLNEEVKKSYRNLETMTLDDARKENVNKENYEKIKKNAKMMTESIENMITVYGFFIKDFEMAENYSVKQLELYLDRISKMNEV